MVDGVVLVVPLLVQLLVADVGVAGSLLGGVGTLVVFLLSFCPPAQLYLLQYSPAHWISPLSLLPLCPLISFQIQC